MDIHKPKAAHSFREFLIEIGTIICGILIALALEQTVDELRTDREVTEAREALHREMAQNLRVAIAWQRQHACWLGAAAAAKAWATGTAGRPSYPPGLMSNYNSSVWDMTRAGAVAHMPLNERLALARFYDSIANDTAVINSHRTLVTEIGGYLERDKLSDQEAAQLVQLTGRLRWISIVESGNGQGILELGTQAHLTPAAPNADPDREARIAEFCRAFAPPTAPSPPAPGARHSDQ